MEAAPRPAIFKTALLWAVVLGAVGFGGGFFGPIALSPDANQGPLLGIFIAGPASFAAGLVLGAAACLLPLSGNARSGVLLVAGIVIATVTLYFSMPSPVHIGERWQAQIAKVTWAVPRAGWKEDAERLAQTDRGVVLELRIYRQRAIYENRKPWNKGSVRPAEWRSDPEIKRFYARFAGAACADYPLGKRETYFPVSEREVETNWPSLALPNFLALQVLGPVPEKYRVLPGEGG
ncbi:MAG: hypothetical protein NTW47_17385 [Proteobacteria bacterium]|nr:hypothetical protein [Pseudomonadota bacterium]